MLPFFYLAGHFLASSGAVSQFATEPHLAPSASVPIPFRGKNVKILTLLIPRWCILRGGKKRGIVQQDTQRDGGDKNDQWGLFRFKMHCVCWQLVGPTLFDVLPLVRL